MTRTDLIRAIQRHPLLDSAFSRMQRHPDDAETQRQFQRELERTPEALAAWRRYHEENAA